jgi:hypothetical protein
VVQESDQGAGALVRLMTVPAHQRDDRWLEESLQKAVELEMSTIPPYLYAAWSIDANQDPSGTRDVIVDIAKEEMLHMGIACNLLASIGGQPTIVRAAPRYPTHLPQHVHKGLQVALEPLSRDLLLRTFMAIEEPATHLVDDPDFVPSGSTLIGEFYDAVQHAFEARSHGFSAARQIDLDDSFFKGAFVVANLDDVRAGIGLIKRQGEGTSAAPFENRADPEELAHLYQFGEIAHGHRLTRTARSPTRVTPSRCRPCGRSRRPTPRRRRQRSSTAATATCSATSTGRGTAAAATPSAPPAPGCSPSAPRSSR